MDESKVLIYHYSTKNQNWYDATKKVVWYKADNNAWLVKFNNSPEFYHVSFEKMKIYTNPKEIDFVEIYYKNSPCYNVNKVLSFGGMMYKIFYNNGYTCVAYPSETKIVKDTLKNNLKASGVMAYYRRVVKETCLSDEDRFMLSQFDDISYVNDESVLSLYLNGELSKSDNKLELPVFCPFGLNMSQALALKMAFHNRISIIEGPPGTGKTQTILNIISNAVIRDKSVAVVSNNNSATNNVFEKLEKYGYSFLCAPLGNVDNVDKFFEEYNTIVPYIKKESVDVKEINKLYLELPKYFEKENLKKQYISSLEALGIEYNHFLMDNDSFSFDTYKFKNLNVSPSDVQSAIVKIKEKEKLSFFDKLSIKWKLKINGLFFSIQKENSILLLQNLYYLAKKNWYKKQIDEINKYMEGESLEDKLTSYRDLSNIYFKNKLSIKYEDNTRSNYNKLNYKRYFNEFVQDYPVVLSSTYALAKCSKKGYLFDYLIVDESSQVNMASAILSMRIAKNIVVVGDIRQLPQIDDSTFNDRNEALLKEFNVPRAYSYQGNSIMSSLLALYGKDIPRQLLREHYRCAPEIINFCNQEFYNNELIVYTEKNGNSKSMEIIKTVPGNFARKNVYGTGLYNQREIDEVVKLLDEEKLDDIGVITPYRCQAELFQDKFKDRLEASTIHKFQGREKKTIIFSSVVNDVNDFVGNDNLINVAVSRAVDKFVLVTSDKVASSKTGVLADLINYISYNQDFGLIHEGNIKSIYDILYSDYENQLTEFRKKHPSKDFDTENITKELLKEILKDDKYRSLCFKMHVSLRDFIKDSKHNLTDEEFKFYINPNAHADFLIYNKMSKKPLLVIEVDGVSYHEQQEKQRIRDAKKDSILHKAGIPILRLKTNESNEKERIITTLENQLLD